jgi:hypothetical protein
MSVDEIIDHLLINLAPDEIAEFTCDSVSDAKAWYMRYRRAIDRASVNTELSISREGNIIRIRKMPKAPAPVIKKLSEVS